MKRRNFIKALGATTAVATLGSKRVQADAKKYKWTNRFSKRRLKCKGAENKKELKVYDICNNAASGNVCTYNNNKYYNGTRLYDQMVIGRMEVNISTGRVDNQGNKKPKKGYLYFQIR